MLHDKWLTARLAYLRGLKAPREQQQQLMLLADELKRTDADSRILAAKHHFFTFYQTGLKA